MYSISRKNGVTELVIPKNHPEKDLLVLSTNFDFLLPRNCNQVSGEVFAKTINETYDSPQADAVAQAIRNC